MTLTFSFRRKNKDVFDLRGGEGRKGGGGGAEMYLRGAMYLALTRMPGESYSR